MAQYPYLNLGCGKVILPTLRKPAHHALVDNTIYHYPQWLNVDRNPAPGVDKIIDVFRYPWNLQSDSFDGALLSHLVEHVPHEIRLSDNSERAQELERCQDGWYAFFSELYRVMRTGAIVHILAPYAWSAGAVTDPTHTRMITEHTFTHALKPDTESPFAYETGNIHFELVQAPVFYLNPRWGHLAPQPSDDTETRTKKQVLFQEALTTQVNVVYDVYAKLRVVK